MVKSFESIICSFVVSPKKRNVPLKIVEGHIVPLAGNPRSDTV